MSTNPKETRVKELEQQLSKLYLSIADIYKRMAKVKDSYSLNIIQTGLDFKLQQVAVLRTQLDTLREELMNDWTAQKNSEPTKFE